MEYTIKPSALSEVKPLLDEYLRTLSGVADDFWEEHILNAGLYQISTEAEMIGCFAIYDAEKLTQFYLRCPYLNLAQPIFRRILEDYSVKTAFVATCDELFLSLCMDFQKRIEPQAYFFDGSVPNAVRAPEFGRECMIPIGVEELPEVKKLTGDFFGFVTEDDLLAKRILLYCLRGGGETLGFGIIVPGKLLPQYASAGMITLEPHRRKGVGRSIQLHLAELCRESGWIPVSGCWYYNHNSKRTIESAGRYSRTRLLNVVF